METVESPKTLVLLVFFSLHPPFYRWKRGLIRVDKKWKKEKKETFVGKKDEKQNIFKGLWKKSRLLKCGKAVKWG